MRTSRRCLITTGAAVLTLVAFGCTGGDEKGGSAPDGAASSSACRSKAGERPAKAVLRCTEASIAFIENELASGTGVVVALDGKRYLLTNEHVVDPFDSADATIGTRSFEDLRVVGIDAAADIALLGPLEGDGLPEALPIAQGTDLARGDDVFLVGFPGEIGANDLEATIASGIVSRLRSVEEFGQSYVQTDASIGDGQSGGPLFDAGGNLIGISGLSFAENFALVLAGKDVETAARRIVKGEGDDYVGLPGAPRADAGDASGSLRVFDAGDGQILFLPAAPEARTWHLSVDMATRPVVSVETFAEGEPLAISGNADEVERELSQQLAARAGRPDDIPDPTATGVDPSLVERETSPGEFTIPVKADESAIVVVGAPLTDAPVAVGWRSDIPLVGASRPVTEETLEVGGKLDRVINSFDTAVDVLVDLDTQQKVELHARSPQGDVGLAVFEPDRKLDHVTMADPEGAGVDFFEDTDDGLYGLDAKTTFEAPTSGRYRFRLYINDASTVHLRFSVLDCTETKCGDAAEPNSSADRGAQKPGG
jgi:trypsin-like peptidase